ncbi:hypothetical protein SKAU_G00298620 [Synaphobranchus kaupii]|uniref:Uncharacterized protein n=1 Tax=Synaphobranchus kaupii TaxID=118154 RepID=A0A9Q1EV75_SYNKA|nr:hypothetical protein SKAU_G00298620 [Synaphobranchus kaupii]
MDALTKMYGQPHCLALQNIAKLMDGANMASGDMKSFCMFALIPIPTLIDLSEWLEYDIQIQEDNVHSSGHYRREFAPKKRGQHKEERPAKATILLSREKPYDFGTKSSEQQLQITPAKVTDRAKAYCPYCDNNDHFVNGCANFKVLSKESKKVGLRLTNAAGTLVEHI